MVQSIVRGKLGRKKAAQRAAQVFKKFLTEDQSAAYYFNTTTRRKQWLKPFLLHDRDIEAVPMASRDERFVVLCELCEGEEPNMATVVRSR